MIVKTSGKMRNHIKARERNGLMEGSLENSEMREFEEDRSRLAAFCSLRETEIMMTMRTAAGRGDWKGNPGRGRRLGRNLAFFPMRKALCDILFFFLLRLKEIIGLSGDPSAGVSVSWTVHFS